MIAVGKSNAQGELRVKTRSIKRQSLSHPGWWMLTQRRDVSEEISKAEKWYLMKVSTEKKRRNCRVEVGFEIFGATEGNRDMVKNG